MISEKKRTRSNRRREASGSLDFPQKHGATDSTKEAMKIKAVMNLVNGHLVKEEDLSHKDKNEEELT